MHSRDSMGSPVPMSRRDFLRLSGAGFAGAVLLGVIGPGKALAQPRNGPREHPLGDASSGGKRLRAR